MYRARFYAGIRKNNGPKVWVYLEVFGGLQWCVLVALLLAIAVVMSLVLAVVGSKAQDGKGYMILKGFTMTALFIIQQGSHPQDRHLSVKLLSIIASVLTLVVFVYYSNDITAKMTVGSPQIPVRTFQQVLDLDYELVLSLDLLYYLMPGKELMAASDSDYRKRYPSRYKLYQKFFEEAFWAKIYPYEMAFYNAQQNQTYATMKAYKESLDKLPSWYQRTDELYDSARDAIIRDPKTLWYCDPASGVVLSIFTGNYR